MGKAQSKRSVDITTDTKKSGEDEVTGKLEKIEDIDQQQKQAVNGDAAAQEPNPTGDPKKEGDQAENDKDLTTEKNEEIAQASAKDDGTENAAGCADAAQTEKADTSAVAVADKEEVAAAAANEEVSPLADESGKKSKKEKVKKKWSLRSISFGKKDKQKPAKTEETSPVEPTAATAAAAVVAKTANENGEAEKAAEDVAVAASIEEKTEPAKQQTEQEVVVAKVVAGGDAVAAAEEQPKATELKLENGAATKSEINEQKTPTATPTDEQKPIAEDTPAVSVPVVAAAIVETAIENAKESVQETTAAVVETVEKAITNTVDTLTAVVSNGNAATVEKNGPIAVEDVAATIEHDAAAAKQVEATVNEVPEAVTENSVSNNLHDVSDVQAPEEQKPHQNGTNNVGEHDIEVEDDAAAVEPTKTQIEVKTNTSIVAVDIDSAESLALPNNNPTSTNPFLSTDHTVPQNLSENEVDENSEIIMNGIENIEKQKTDTNTIVCNGEHNDEQMASVEQNVDAPIPKNNEASVVAVADVVGVAGIIGNDLAKTSEPNVSAEIDAVALDTSILNNSIEPPPLPTYPPPSQVSVFALNNGVNANRCDAAVLEKHANEEDININGIEDVRANANDEVILTNGGNVTDEAKEAEQEPNLNAVYEHKHEEEEAAAAKQKDGGIDLEQVEVLKKMDEIEQSLAACETITKVLKDQIEDAEEETFNEIVDEEAKPIDKVAVEDMNELVAVAAASNGEEIENLTKHEQIMVADLIEDIDGIAADAVKQNNQLELAACEPITKGLKDQIEVAEEEIFNEIIKEFVDEEEAKPIDKVAVEDMNELVAVAAASNGEEIENITKHEQIMVADLTEDIDGIAADEKRLVEKLEGSEQKIKECKQEIAVVNDAFAAANNEIENVAEIEQVAPVAEEENVAIESEQNLNEKATAAAFSSKDIDCLPNLAEVVDASNAANVAANNEAKDMALGIELLNTACKDANAANKDIINAVTSVADDIANKTDADVATTCTELNMELKTRSINNSIN